MKKLFFIANCLPSILFALNHHSHQISVTKADGKVWVEGNLTITFTSAANERCFYLAYNDVGFGRYRSLASRLNPTTNQSDEALYRGGETIVEGKNIDWISGQLFRIRSKSKTVSFNYRSTPPRLDASSPDEYLFADFYPRALQECPTKSYTSYSFVANNYQEVEVVRVPKGFTLTHPSTSQQAPEFNFALLRNFDHSTVTIANVPIEIHSRGEDLTRLLPTLRSSLAHLQSYLGEFPFKKLIIIESSELHRDNLSGIIAINRPRQNAFQSLQANWLNWRHWAMVFLLTRQWLGAATQTNLDDFWLLRGIGEFLSQDFFYRYHVRDEIFNHFEVGFSFIEMNYRELQDLAAAFLYVNHPKLVLTDNKLKTSRPYIKQPSLVSIKQAIAMRHLQSEMGISEFKQVIKGYLAKNKFTTVKPSSFFSNVPPKHRETIKQWWTIPGWPDQAIDDVTCHNFGNCKVTVKNKGELKFSPVVTLIDKQDRRYNASITKESRYTYYATAQLQSPLKEVIIDEQRSLFDSNRFNNTLSFPSVEFFPGSAKSLSDDGYTVFWFPFPFRRPGQPWSLGLNLGIFRYINNGVFGLVETEFGSKHRSAFRIAQRTTWPSMSLIGLVGAKQDIFGSRVLEASLQRDPLLNIEPRISVSAGVRHRQIVGEKDTAHQTLVTGFSIVPRGQVQTCGYKLGGEYESAPKETSKEFYYERRYGVAIGYCEVFRGYHLQLRGFRGEISSSGDIPEELNFNPEDLIEARIRADVGNLKRPQKLFSAGVDFFIPFYIPIPGHYFVLGRQLKWRGFYDYGYSLDLETEYRASGGGVLLPIGGDVTSIGAFAILRLSLIGVFYSKIGDEISRKPRFLLDFSGEL